MACWRPQVFRGRPRSHLRVRRLHGMVWGGRGGRGRGAGRVLRLGRLVGTTPRIARPRSRRSRPPSPPPRPPPPPAPSHQKDLPNQESEEKVDQCRYAHARGARLQGLDLAGHQPAQGPPRPGEAGDVDADQRHDGRAHRGVACGGWGFRGGAGAGGAVEGEGEGGLPPPALPATRGCPVRRPTRAARQPAGRLSPPSNPSMLNLCLLTGAQEVEVDQDTDGDLAHQHLVRVAGFRVWWAEGSGQWLARVVRK